MTEKWDWHFYFMKLCKEIATKSKDPSTKIGAIIVGPDNEIRNTGYNGFPRGIEDRSCNVAKRFERPLKYKFTEHAERNAIYQAAKNGVHTDGCTIYVSSLLPCTDCARAIIQCGIKKVVCEEREIPERWKEDLGIALEMLKEAGIRIVYVPMKGARNG